VPKYYNKLNIKIKKMRILLSLLITLLANTSFAQNDFSLGEKGLLYKIIPNTPSGNKVKIGNVIQVAIEQKFGDSLTYNSAEAGNEFMLLDTSNQPFDIKVVLRQMSVGDSAMVKINVDSIFEMQCKMAQEQQGISREQFASQLPEFFRRKGEFINLGLKVIKQYVIDSTQPNYASDKAQVTIDQSTEGVKKEAYQQKMQMKAQQEQALRDEKGIPACNAALVSYLGAKLKTLKKTKSGAYVEIIKEGTGPLCVKGKTAELRYKGMLLNGNVFDGNFPETGKPTKPLLPVNILAGGTVPGFDEGISLLRQGTKAKLYIPCNLGYGGQAQGTELPAYSSLIFDIEVVTVKGGTTPSKQTPTKKAPVKKAPVKKIVKKNK
jgi:FKBP-type peptidyl-prolyl cis-trans isomerase